MPSLSKHCDSNEGNRGDNGNRGNKGNKENNGNRGNMVLFLNNFINIIKNPNIYKVIKPEFFYFCKFNVNV